MSAKVIKYGDSYKYQLRADHEVQTPIKGAAFRIDHYAELTQDGLLRVYRGYSWDGASGPTLDSPCAIAPSCEHDVFYQAMRSGKLGQEFREPVDEFFYSRLLSLGMWRPRALLWLTAIRKAAAYAAKRQDERTILAPA
jgi:hypothetical protein